MKSVDFLKMPECIMNTTKVRMDERERKQYETLKEELLLRVPRGTAPAPQGTVPAGANVSAKVMLGGAEYAGTVDAENGAVAFEIPSDAVTAGGTYSGTVSVTVDGAVYSKEVSLVQGTLRTEADAEWIRESASDFGTTGSWSGEQVSAAAGKISVSNAVFTAAKSAPASGSVRDQPSGRHSSSPSASISIHSPV